MIKKNIKFYLTINVLYDPSKKTKKSLASVMNFTKKIKNEIKNVFDSTYSIYTFNHW